MSPLYSSCGFFGFGKRKEDNAGLCGTDTKLSDDGVCVASLPKLTAFVEIEQAKAIIDTCSLKKDLPWCADVPMGEKAQMEKWGSVHLESKQEINDIRREYYEPFCESYSVGECNTSKCKVSVEKGKCIFDESKIRYP